MDDGSRHMVWMLAVLLTSSLTHCFYAGALPPCISLALFTQIHKKGCNLNAAIHRPIAVGKPLHRLYIMNTQKKAGGVA